MSEPLMDVIVQTVLFLELSDDQAIDSDIAVSMLEQIAATLQRLKPLEKERLVRYLRERAAATASDDERRVLESMAGNLGITVS